MGIGRGGTCYSVAQQQGEILHGLGAKPWCWVCCPPPPRAYPILEEICSSGAKFQE